MKFKDRLSAWAAGDTWISVYLIGFGNDGTNLGSRVTLASLTAVGENFVWSGAEGRTELFFRAEGAGVPGAQL